MKTAITYCLSILFIVLIFVSSTGFTFSVHECNSGHFTDFKIQFLDSNQSMCCGNKIKHPKDNNNTVIEKQCCDYVAQTFLTQVNQYDVKVEIPKANSYDLIAPIIIEENFQLKHTTNQSNTYSNAPPLIESKWFPLIQSFLL